MAATTGSDAARRIPGVTLVGGRFIMVRGLNQRYNAVLINGMMAPSSEPDSRSFSFDLLPSSSIETMNLYKGEDV